jgi:hypothetical protein
MSFLVDWDILVVRTLLSEKYRACDVLALVWFRPFPIGIGHVFRGL